MKASQKLKVSFESFEVVVKFEDLDVKLLPLALKLEKEGDIWGPVADVSGRSDMCVSMRYADKKREGILEAKIFGYPADEFMKRQYK